MANEAGVALSRLVAALEHHFEMARNADVVAPAILEDAELRLQDALFTYDDALFTSYGVELPIELLDDLDDGDDDDEEDALDNLEDSVADLLDED